MATIFRTYETFEIVWDRGSRWTGYDSAEEAQAVIDGTTHGEGRVNRSTFEVRLHPELLGRGMYRPGLADRFAA